MVQTLRAVFPAVDVVPLNDGLAAVFNAEASDFRRQFEVVKVYLTPVSGGVSQSSGVVGPSIISLYRISAFSGGDEVAAVKRDTASANLPSQVTCNIFPDSVTLGDRFRRLADAPSFTFGGAGNLWLTARVYGGGAGFNADYMRFEANADVEKITLRAGEGIAFVLEAEGWPHSAQINITVRNPASGATYQFRTRDIGSPRSLNAALVTIFNASGSGVVLEVKAAIFPLDGESNLPGVRLARIAGINGGDPVTPVRQDTGTASPAALVCRSAEFVAVLNGDGAMIDWNTTHGATFSVAQQQNIGVMRRQTAAPRPFPAPAQATTGMMTGRGDTVLFAARAGEGIFLNPGEGLAVLAGRAGALETSTFAYCDVAMEILHYPPPAGGAGGGIRVAGHGGLAA